MEMDEKGKLCTHHHTHEVGWIHPQLSHSKITSIGCANGWDFLLGLKICLSYLDYSQILLDLPWDDHHFTYIFPMAT